jgi:hypothetical protein
MTERFYGAAGDDRAGDQPGAARPLADEALRLLSSAQGWAQGWADRNLGGAGDGHTGGECQWCPHCQFMALLRGERPDITDRVAEAGTALAAALRVVAEAAAGASTAHQPAAPPLPRVRKIKLDDEV